MDIQTGYLIDYLDARNAALVLVYFQSRSVRESTDGMEIEDEGWKKLEIQELPAKTLPRQLDGVYESYPHCELHWFYPISPTLSDRSAEGESEANRKLQFRTIDGNSFSPEDVENHEGFSEAGLKRPAYRAESLQEAMSFYDWVFFDMEVLEKYIQSDDGHVNWWSEQGADVAWKDLFAERVYRNNELEIALLLDDLEFIPNRQIPHWKVHNIAPSGKIPEEGIMNFILAQSVDSTSYSDRVLDAIDEINDKFEGKHGVRAFNPLEKSDPTHLLIMPARNERDTLLERMDALNKLFFERINTDNIREALPEKRKGNINGSKSALFELTAEQIGEGDAIHVFEPINGCYDLRVAADHREATSKWERSMKSFELSPYTDEYREAYRDIMTQTAEALEVIHKSL